MAGNPYLESQAGAITDRVTTNLQRNILPGISSGAIAAGGYGGSRQGIAEANAIGQTNQGLSDSLANLYGQNFAQNQNFNLGLGSLALQNQGQNQNFYTQNRNLDQQGAQLGANLYNGGNAGYLGIGTGIGGIGNTQQQAPWQPFQNAGNAFSQFAGLGGSQQTTLQGNPIGGAIGGGLAGAQIGRNLGFGQTQQQQDPFMVDYYGMGTNNTGGSLPTRGGA